MKFKQIGELFFRWKNQAQLGRQAKIMEQAVTQKRRLRRNAQFFIGLLKNRQTAFVKKKVRSYVQMKEGITNQTVNKLRFEITRWVGAG